jgi:D-glycero-D-manno-heptose 1,7-bisphosphate phosphatase
MSERAIFLDRDNTIIEDDGYIGDPAKVKLLPGAATALASMRALGYRLIVVSNQSGVGRGMFKEADVEAVNDEMSRQLKAKAGAYVDASYYCPYHPDATIVDYRIDHDWRKPKPGMLRQAAADFSLDLSQCWMIGDAPRDVAAGAAAGCRTILLRDPDKNPVSNSDAISVTPNFVVKSLADAARIIVREGRTHPAPAPAAASAPTAAAATDAAPAASSHLTLTPPTPDAPGLASAAVDAAAAAAKSAAAPAEAPAPEPGRPSPRRAETPPAPAAQLPSRVMLSSHLEKSLDDLVIQLRQQNRNADLRPDFSYSSIAALLCQLAAAAALLVGMITFFNRTHSLASQADLENAIRSLLAAIVWVGTAVFFQGAVIALLLYSRHKRG